MLLVQQYLETHSFGDLAREHGVYASFSKSGHKWSLNYDQIEAKEADPIAQESRGLILAKEDGSPVPGVPKPERAGLDRDQEIPGKTKILAFPMKRFFNHGQGSAADIDWSDPKLAVLEKLDGTLCIVYHDPFTKQWCVATRSVPEADLTMDNGIFTFRTLFEKALKDTAGLDFQDFVRGLNRNITYCFELTTPYNRIVVYYPECRITLLAARALYGEMQEFDFTNLGGMGWVDYKDLTDGVKEHLLTLGHDASDTPAAFVPVPFNLCGVPVVKGYTYNTIDELVNWVSSLNPMEHEGVVVRDSKFNRIKVKNAAYVAYNKVRDALASSPRNMVGIILAEKDDDVIPMLPEDLANHLKEIKVGLVAAIKQYDVAYQEALAQATATNPGDKKTFALLITQNKKFWTAPFFQMFDGKASSMRDFIQKNKKEGTWPDGFLDKMLELSKNYQA
jgi:hypothetical protein